MQKIHNLSSEDLDKYIVKNKYPKFRSTQIWNFLYHNYAESFDEMHNLPQKLIEQLKKDFYFDLPKEKILQISKDKTQKALLELADDSTIETVLMEYNYGYSVCVTTQVGCKIGCSFCASHLGGFQRNLDASEIINQILYWEKKLALESKRVSHIVVMGIGEPFDNLDNVLKFIDIVNDNKGLAIGARRITVSTSGIVPKFEKFSNYDKQINLAISLHAPNDELRSKIMKINDVYNLEQLLEAVEKYQNFTNRQVTFEYIMLKDLNDSQENAKELSDLIGSLDIHVNLIPYNNVYENAYQKSTNERIEKFFKYLVNYGVNVSIRGQKGDDIDGACGQLRNKKG